MKSSRTAIVAAALLIGAAAPAFAKPPHCPPGHEKKGECSRYDDRYWHESREQDRAYDQGFRDGQRQARWEIGHRLPDATSYVVIRDGDYDRYHLSPPPRGNYYAEVDGQVLLIQAATQLVLQALVRN